MAEGRQTKSAKDFTSKCEQFHHEATLSSFLSCAADFLMGGVSAVNILASIPSCKSFKHYHRLLLKQVLLLSNVSSSLSKTKMRWYDHSVPFQYVDTSHVF